MDYLADVNFFFNILSQSSTSKQDERITVYELCSQGFPGLSWLGLMSYAMISMLTFKSLPQVVKENWPLGSKKTCAWTALEQEPLAF